jgi:hypothetical protein
MSCGTQVSIIIQDLLFQLSLAAENHFAFFKCGANGQKPRGPAEHRADLIAEGAGLGTMENGYHSLNLSQIGQSNTRRTGMFIGF